jgi:hypothetical protein
MPPTPPPQPESPYEPFLKMGRSVRDALNRFFPIHEVVGSSHDDTGVTQAFHKKDIISGILDASVRAFTRGVANTVPGLGVIASAQAARQCAREGDKVNARLWQYNAMVQAAGWASTPFFGPAGAYIAEGVSVLVDGSTWASNIAHCLHPTIGKVYDMVPRAWLTVIGLNPDKEKWPDRLMKSPMMERFFESRVMQEAGKVLNFGADPQFTSGGTPPGSNPGTPPPGGHTQTPPRPQGKGPDFDDMPGGRSAGSGQSQGGQSENLRSRYYGPSSGRGGPSPGGRKPDSR